MIISHDYRFIFFEVPKTGTSTLHARLGQFNNYLELEKPIFNNELNKVISRHIWIDDLQQLPIYEECKDYFKFCFIRNPYDYFYSRSQFDASPTYIKHREENGKHDAAWRIGKRKLEKLKQCTDENGNFLFRNYLKLFNSLHNIRSGGFFKRWTHQGNSLKMNFIGKNERFEEDFKKVCEIIGLPYNEIPTLSKNINTKPLDQSCDSFFGDGLVYKYLHHYEVGDLEVINRKCKQDFELFDYRMIASNELIEYKNWCNKR